MSWLINQLVALQRKKTMMDSFLYQLCTPTHSLALRNLISFLNSFVNVLIKYFQFLLVFFFFSMQSLVNISIVIVPSFGKYPPSHQPSFYGLFPLGRQSWKAYTIESPPMGPKRGWNKRPNGRLKEPSGLIRYVPNLAQQVILFEHSY